MAIVADPRWLRGNSQAGPGESAVVAKASIPLRSVEMRPGQRQARRQSSNCRFASSSRCSTTPFAIARIGRSPLREQKLPTVYLNA
jgi:hypothetical protein